MQNFYKKLFLFFIFLNAALSSYSTHIVGGELYYRYLGNYNYEITLIVYRDCYYGNPPFDPGGCIGVFDVNNSLITNISFPVDPDSITIPSTINSPCFVPPVDVCYRKAFYKSNSIHLPPRPGGYQLVYQRCCRNNSILNIQNPGGTGISIYATISGDSILAQNNNPVFDTIAPASVDTIALPPDFICLGVPFAFNNSAIDDDGDSLVYELCNPFEGLSTGNPGPTCPDAPPYANVVWQIPFSLANLLGGIPLTIDSQTGLLTATPNTIGQFVIGICVQEFRNGIFVSRTRRDYQLNVVPCPTLIVAALQTPLINCGSNTVQFQNHSIGATTYQWNFGDPGVTNDTSIAFNPSYTYPDTGTYTVTLIAHSGINPACADTTTGIVHIYPPFTADFSFTDSICSFLVHFTDTSGNIGSGVTSGWNWTFGDATSSNIHNPIHNYPGPGSFNVTLIATSDKGCKDTITKTVTLDTLPSVTISVSQPIQCHGDCNASAAGNPTGGTQPYSYQWNDSNSQTTQTAINLCAGTYTLTLTDSNGCVATKNITINEPLPLSASVSSTDAYCNGRCIGTASTTPSGGTAPFTYSWNDPGNQQASTATDLCPGLYTVIITDAHGCVFTDSVTVNFSTYIPPLDATVSDDTIFEGQTIQLSSTVYNNTTYTWVPSNSLSNPNISNPSATLNSTGVYTYEVMIIDSNGCENRDTVRIVVLKVSCAEPQLFIPNAFTPNDDGSNDVLYVRGDFIRELLLRIYDRWGEKVFETNVPGAGWNGTYKGKPVQPGVYDYYLEGTCFNNEKFFKKGNVTVIK